MNSAFKLLPEMQLLLHTMEQRWYDVSEGNLTEKEIYNLQLDMKQKKNQIVNQCFPNGTIPEKKKIGEKAEQISQMYINRYYPAEQKNGQE